jgi:predicted permease
MRRLREWVLRLVGLFNQRRKDQDLEKEIESHLELHIADNLRSGLTPEEARREAMIKLGGIESMKEAYRDQRGLPWLETTWQDVRYALRLLAKNPGFTAVTVLTLALGIGSNTAIFSIANSVLFKPLPYKEPGQLVQLWEAPELGKRNSVSPGAFLDWKEHATVFEGLWVVDETERNLTGRGEPERIRGLGMSAQGLEMLRVHPFLGRVFVPEEDQIGKDKVVVLTEGWWRRSFGGKPDVLGQSIQLNDQSYTIVGVIPERALLWKEAEFVTPFTLSPQEANQRSVNWLRVMGRLKRGVSVEEGQVAMNTLAAQLKPLYPAYKKNWGVMVVPLRDEITGDIRPTLLLLLGAVSFVLLIACGNVANLHIAKASSRQKEMAIRATLGATRWRVTRQLLIETTLLSIFGGVVGVLTAIWSVQAVSQLSGISLPRTQEISVDLRALGFALVTSVAAGLIITLLPARQISRSDLNDTLKSWARGSAAGSESRTRGAMIAVEVALSFVLLIAAGLLLNSFVRVSSVPPGIGLDNAMTMQISLPQKKYPNWERRAAFFGQVIERIAGLPGIEASGVLQTPPLAGYRPETAFSISGRPPGPNAIQPVGMDFCTPDFFRAAGIPLIKGRRFGLRDTVGQPRVAIINQALAREYFPNEDPLGKRLQLEPGRDDLYAEWEIVGVVGDVRQHGLTEPAKPGVYRPLAFSYFGNGASLIVRSSVNPLALMNSIRQAVLEVDPNQPVTDVRTLEDVVANSMAQRRFALGLIGGFAGAALLLAAIGLYGVVAYTVSKRTQEIGIRIALGAARGNILALVLGQGMKLVGLGIFIGMAAAVGLTRLLRNMLYEVQPTDFSTFLGVALVLSIVAMFASWLPARRAMKLDPVAALRSE